MEFLSNDCKNLRFDLSWITKVFCRVLDFAIFGRVVIRVARQCIR